MGHLDVINEHRATLICIAVLHELKPALEENSDRRRSVETGVKPERDRGLTNLVVRARTLRPRPAKEKG
jgi:hypothetical protein